MTKKNHHYLSYLDCGQSLCVSLGQIQLILLNIELFHVIRRINRNYILQNEHRTKKITILISRIKHLLQQVWFFFLAQTTTLISKHSNCGN